MKNIIKGLIICILINHHFFAGVVLIGQDIAYVLKASKEDKGKKREK